MICFLNTQFVYDCDYDEEDEDEDDVREGTNVKKTLGFFSLHSFLTLVKSSDTHCGLMEFFSVGNRGRFVNCRKIDFHIFDFKLKIYCRSRNFSTSLFVGAISVDIITILNDSY